MVEFRRRYTSQAIRQFFRDQGYTEDSLSRLGLANLPWHGLAERSNSSWTVAGDARLDLLIRLFYLGHAVATSQGEKIIPKEILRDLLAIGILERDGERLQSTCLLMHFGELILACDSRRRAAAGGADLVLGCQSDHLVAGQVLHASSRGEGFGSRYRLWHARAGRGSPC